MTARSYDAIVVGARCAGSPTAMLLARGGHRVLLVDRATFPSDTISTHLIHPPGVAILKKWGLLDRLIATGCPAISTYAFDFGPFVLEGSPGTPESPVSYAPRRTVLDKLLVDAAVDAGVEFRDAFTVESLIVDNGRVAGIRGHQRGGPPIDERATIVVGADGLHSLVAREAGATSYKECEQLQAGYYTYWSNLPVSGFEAYDRGDRAFAVWPTHDGLTVVVASWPFSEFEANRHDVERHYMAIFDRTPAFRDRLQAARREDRFYGAAVPNYLRVPYGPGWALVGDAGYLRDFITAQGISDAFRDANACAAAIDDGLRGRRAMDDGLRAYQSARDAAVMPIYEFTQQFARLQPPPPEMQALFGAMRGNRDAVNGFARVIAGVTSPAEFFHPDNVVRIIAAAGQA